MNPKIYALKIKLNAMKTKSQNGFLRLYAQPRKMREVKLFKELPQNLNSKVMSFLQVSKKQSFIFSFPSATNQTKTLNTKHLTK